MKNARKIRFRFIFLIPETCDKTRKKYENQNSKKFSMILTPWFNFDVQISTSFNQILAALPFHPLSSFQKLFGGWDSFLMFSLGPFFRSWFIEQLWLPFYRKWAPCQASFSLCHFVMNGLRITSIETKNNNTTAAGFFHSYGRFHHFTMWNLPACHNCHIATPPASFQQFLLMTPFVTTNVYFPVPGHIFLPADVPQLASSTTASSDLFGSSNSLLKLIWTTLMSSMHLLREAFQT